MNTIDFGKRGEEAAVAYLLENGFTIRDTNWRWGHKELDIVAVKNKTLHIIEVKTRRASFLLNPQMSVDRRKQQHTVAAANAYVQRFELEHDVQFDIITVVINGDKNEIEYLPDAFYPTAR
ncbi:MAG: YraN family protein [Prevotellaceae bacterium]|jgi:putative endonuclease|nr:YraN family protein [Prevotellaceae bacterium]